MPQKLIHKHTSATFWERVEKGASEACWHWKGATTPSCYGIITYHKRQWRAHRLAWVLTHGEIPAGLLVCHRCDNPICCNPGHLFLGSSLDNSRDMVQKGRSARGDKHGTRNGSRVMPRGEQHHFRLNPEAAARGEGNAAAVLSEDAVREIRRLYSAGEMGTQRLGKKFGVSKRTITFIVQGKTWKHLL